jgi:hypothetical protein
VTQYQNIPDELKALPQWVCWRFETRNGKRTKVPITPRTGQRANTADPTAWGTFTEAKQSLGLDPSLKGVGFVFSKTDPYVGIDIDDCIGEDLQYSDEATDAIQAFGSSYFELSPSGSGLKFWIKGVLPTPKSGRKNRELDVEAYHYHRFFAMTGNVLGSPTNSISDCNDSLQSWFQKKFPVELEDSASECFLTECPVSAQIVIDTASNADPEFKRMFEGDMSRFDENHSSADLALCNRISYWAGPDPERIDEVFRQSGLFRDKWERRDYRDGTITKAINSIATGRGFYDWQSNFANDFNEVIQSGDWTGLQLSSAADVSTGSSITVRQTNGPDFGFIDSTTFAERKYESHWLVPYVLKQNQPCIVAGPSKTLKTTFLVELSVSLASGKPLWNRPQYQADTRRVALVSAESGEETLQETAFRVCLSKGVEFKSLATNLFWAFRAPDISATSHIMSLAAFVLENKIDILIIDPAYLSMGNIGESVSNQFAVGAVLEKLSELARYTGCTPLLAAHTNKGCSVGKQLQLPDIAYAGFGQWARSYFQMLCSGRIFQATISV